MASDGAAAGDADIVIPDWAREDPDLTELFRSFVRRLPARADSLEAMLERADLQGLVSEAHQLKGTAGAYGFPHISEAASSLEQCVRARLALETVRHHVHEVAVLCRLAAHPE